MIEDTQTDTLPTKKELANSLIHGLGVLFAIISMPALMMIAYRHENQSLMMVAGVYGFSFLLVFSFSTLYHALQQPFVKEVMKILDHISIFFLIAGTYTPLVYCYFNNWQGMLLLKVLWSLALFGIFFKVFFVNRLRVLSIAIYLSMGWLLLWTGKSFFAAMPKQVIVLILTGNFLYSVGLVFYLWKRWVYHHAYWHTLVLVAAICHYLSIAIALREQA